MDARANYGLQYYSIGLNGAVRTGEDENRMLLNLASANVFRCTNFMEVHKSVLAYERYFHASYEVPFEEAQIADIINGRESANFIPSVYTQR